MSTATAAGTTVDGLTIIGSSLTAVTTSGSYSVEDNSSYYKNVAIIVGIVIPIGISKFIFYFSYFVRHYHCFNEERCHLC